MSDFFWQKKRVLITGASGFIGSNIAAELIKKGSQVFALVQDRDSRRNPFFESIRTQYAEIIEGDVRRYDFLEKLFQEKQFDTCFHCAAQPVVRHAFDNPISTFEINVQGTLHILEAARRSRTIERLVLASTMHVYGDAKPPFLEHLPLQSTRPYETSKVCADLVAQMYFYTYGLPLAIFRCTNTYGPGDMNFSRIVPKTMKAIVQNKNPEIAGGTSRRDYISIADVVRAYLLLAENLHRPEIRGQAFNFGSGTIVSGRELVQKILGINNLSSLTMVVLPSDLKKEIDEQYVSSEKALKLLGWKPLFSLEEGLRKTYDWYQVYASSL